MKVVRLRDTYSPKASRVKAVGLKLRDGRSKNTVRALEPNLGCPGSMALVHIPTM